MAMTQGTTDADVVANVKSSELGLLEIESRDVFFMVVELLASA
jgi:hypothetical protein